MDVRTNFNFERFERASIRSSFDIFFFFFCQSSFFFAAWNGWRRLAKIREELAFWEEDRVGISAMLFVFYSPSSSERTNARETSHTYYNNRCTRFRSRLQSQPSTRSPLRIRRVPRLAFNWPLCFDSNVLTGSCQECGREANFQNDC